MRIVFINHWARARGGAEMSLLDILDHAASRAECHLITTEPGPLLDAARARGIHTHVVPCLHRGSLRRWHLLAGLLLSWRDVVAFVLFAARVARLLRSLVPDVVHANVPRSHMTLFLARCFGFAGSCVFHMREIFPRAGAAGALYSVLYPLRKARTIAISHAVKARLPRRMQRTCTVIHNGVFVPPLEPKHPPISPLRFVYLGRIVPWKGCRQLVEAFAALKQRHASVPMELSLVGDTLYWSPVYREELSRHIAELGIDTCCTLLPHDDDPHAALGTHHVFCTAATEEPFGRSVAEAQACGLPVVAWRSGGIVEIVTPETGLLVDMGKFDAFTGAMERFVREPELVTSMGIAGRSRMQALFNRQKQVPRLWDLLATMQ